MILFQACTDLTVFHNLNFVKTRYYFISVIFHTYYILKVSSLRKYAFSHMLMVSLIPQQFISKTIEHLGIDHVTMDPKEAAECLYLAPLLLYSHFSYSLFFSKCSYIRSLL